MKSILAGFAAVVLAIGVGSVVSAHHEKGHDGGGGAGGNMVDICHFPGHDGVKGGDFQVGGKGDFGCEKLGGNVITVSVNAAENGHGVIVKGGPGK